MGRKGKQGYDFFDGANQATIVQLPRLDPRQPEQADRTQTSIAKAAERLKGCQGRSHPPSILSRSELPEGNSAKEIRVKIPHFTNNTISPEHLTPSSITSATSSAHRHRKRNSCKTFTPTKASIQTSSTLLLARLPKVRVRVPRKTKCQGPARHSNVPSSKHVKKSKLSVSNSGAPSQLKVASGGSVRLSGRQGRRKAAMRAARSHYRDEKAKNKSRGNNNQFPSTPAQAVSTPKPGPKSSPGSHPTDRPSINTPSPPAITPKPELKSSAKIWNEYAAHTSAGSPPHSTRPPRFVKPRGRDMSNQPPSLHRRLGFAAQRQCGGPIARRYDDWMSWVEVRVNLNGLTPDIGTHEIARTFHQEGKIAVIEVFEDSSGSRTGKAKITFRPPPASAFWLRDDYSIYSASGVCHVQMDLEPQRRTFLAPSPVNPHKKYQELMVLNAKSVDFGFMYEPTTMMSMFTASASHNKSIQFRQSMLHREVVVELEIAILDPRSPHTHPDVGKHNRFETIRFRIPFRHLEVIQQLPTEPDKLLLLMSLDQPPQFFRKVDELGTHEENGRYWTENDAWYRQTDIIYDPTSLRTSPLTLKKTKPIIDIGRWTTYCFSFDLTPNECHLFDEMCQALKDHNIRFSPFPGFRLLRDQEPAVWDFIDKPIATQTNAKHVLEELTEDVVPRLSFQVRYQLEVCISQGLLNEHNLTHEFVTRLMIMDEVKARDLLEYVANQKKRVYDPVKMLSMNVTKSSASRRNIPPYCMYSRSAIVTPSTVYYNTPTVETSNRVVRQYAEYADRFLRVRFTDEKSEGHIYWTEKDTMDEVFTRIKRTMKNGIIIGDRYYEFLAFGNSQFREHGAYFFAPLVYLTANHIRTWMGEYSHINTVAKYAARLGQCFSTTRAINCTRVTIKEIEDIERNGYVFSDGVGKISPFLAQLATGELGLTTPEPPSVFQFRLGGCKGVLAVWPDVKFREIHIRKSQYKFPAKHEGLEIIRCSSMASANLNRQLISVLSSRGIPDDVFVRKLKLQLVTLEQAMTEEKPAITLLQKTIDHNQMTMALVGMIMDGFHRTREPFLVALLHLWRAWSIKYLKEKARISIGDGAQLLGCTDETGTLKGHYNHVIINETGTRQEKEALLPEVFVQLSKGSDNKPYVVEGLMLLARNPSLHPGDVRVVRGVDVPALRHLKDVVVLPQTGDRDLAGMCSGGDLDGDDFVVMWDQDLLPPESQWIVDPMDYTAPEPLKVEREVTTDDITSFFVTYIKNDSLPTIAIAHVAQADFADDGVKDEKCLKLAALHSMAVDYNKTGIPARMTRDLRPRKWPHFMEKHYQPKERIYQSGKILGQLFDQVERVAFEPKFDGKYDERILNAFDLDYIIIQQAADLKSAYDAAMHRIMAQHEIKTEFEVWSTFVMQHSNHNDYKFHEEIGRLSQTLKDDFRAQCYRMAGGKDYEYIAPFAAAMYHVTHEEIRIALAECSQMVTVAGVDVPLRKQEASSMPLCSFPWLFPNILGRIANGDHPIVSEDLALPVQGEQKRFVPKQKVFQIDNQDLLLETAEGVTHQGENLVLFENQEGSENEEDGQQMTPKSTPASVSTVTSKNSTSNNEEELLIQLNGDELDVQPSKYPPPGAGSTQSSSSTVSTNSSVEDRGALGPQSVHPVEPFHDEGTEAIALSRILTPSSHSESAIADKPDDAHGGKAQSAESLINLDDTAAPERSPGDENDEDSDDEEELVHIQMDTKVSPLDRLNKLIERAT